MLKLQVRDAIIGAFQQVVQHSNALVSRNVLCHHSDGGLDGEHHSDQGVLKLFNACNLVELPLGHEHIRRVDACRSARLLDLLEMNLQLRGNRYEQHVIVYS